MKVSYNWLQSYFEEPLPSAERVVEALTFHAFEIEETVTVGKDSVIDVNVLPSRSSDCLSHRGIAKELAVIFNIPLTQDPFTTQAELKPRSKELSVTLPETALIKRFTSAVIKNVKVGPSPDWLKARLEAIGQRSINNVVDITNYVMFDLGQPLHAFDAGKLVEKEGKRILGARLGKGGEKVLALDDMEYEVGEEDLLIIDGTTDTPLGIAGVKGGKASEITESTQTVILEAANFDRTHVRKTSQRLKLRTDASSRFENEPSPEIAAHGLMEAVRLLEEIAGGTLEGYIDEYTEKPAHLPVSVSKADIEGLLGMSLGLQDIEDILKRFGFAYEKSGEVFTVTPPCERTDIQIKEDLIEEIGRIYGYEHIKPAKLEKAENIEVNKRFYYSEKIRKCLLGLGFSEVYTSSFRSAGDVELANALASDKNFLRKNLSDNLKDALDLNERNAPLLGLETVKLFEIGNTFPGEERVALALGVRGTTKADKKAEGNALQEAIQPLESTLGVSLAGEEADGIFEIDLGVLVEELPEPTSYEHEPLSHDVLYQPFSQYPFALRDIAVWTPAGTTPEDVMHIVQKETGDLLVRHTLFDQFEKEGKISYAFHLVFQSNKKTLSDIELNGIMENVSKQLTEQGFEVR